MPFWIKKKETFLSLKIDFNLLWVLIIIDFEEITYFQSFNLIDDSSANLVLYLLFIAILSVKSICV